MEKATFIIEETTIEEIQQAFASKELTSVELVQLYLDRIEQIDKNGPKINSVLSINPDALQIAEELDAMRGQDGQGPLYGIPVLVKDNIDTTDEMPTTAGTLALQENYAMVDSHVAAQLRAAGAIILGKANLSEWAYFMAENGISGYSAIGGQVLNPYGIGKFEVGKVGGSSSGTGAAIAANLAVVGIGTETSGSILSPASANSIVGIKPTVGLISRTGIIPISESQDTAGPMARTVTDAAILLGVLTGIDKEDTKTLESDGHALKDYTPHLQKDALQGARIGVDRTFMSGVDSEQRKVMEAAIADIEAQGAVLVEVVMPRPEFESDVLWYEFKRGVDKYLSNTPETVPVKSLADVIKFNKEDAETRMKFGQVELEKAQALTSDPSDSRYVEHREIDLRQSTEEGIDAIMTEHNLDALLFENNNGAAMPAKAGYPSITVPAGYTRKGMPVGVTFSGMSWSEAKLISFAYAYEQATKRRIKPVIK